MKDLISCIILIISLCSLHISTLYFNYKDRFNINNVMQHIENLSSDTYKGRLCGTKENEAIEDYIEKYFAWFNLSPFTENYKDNFIVNYPNKLSNKPFLQLRNGFDEIHRTFKYGIDFKEDFINFKVNEAKFTMENTLKNQEKSLHLSTKNGVVILYEHDPNDKFRSSFIENSDCALLIFVTKDTLLDVKKCLSEGMSLTIKIPYEIRQTTVNNLSSKINGLSKNKKIIFTSHFDYLGENLLGDIYSGALDGASGTAFILELSKFLKRLPPPIQDIAFVSFNAEEFGLLGSKDFVEKNMNIIENSTVINFSTIGGEKKSQINIIGGKDDTADKQLIKDFSTILTEEGIDFTVGFDDSNDHSSFISKGIDAITLADSRSDTYHTPYDRAENIEKDNIKRCFNVVWEYLLKTAYKDNIFLKHDDIILLFSIVIIFITLSLKFQRQGFY